MSDIPVETTNSKPASGWIKSMFPDKSAEGKIIPGAVHENC